MSHRTSKPPVKFSPLAVNLKARKVTGLASTWNLDQGGDVIRKGAYAKTLETWRREGYVIPLLDSHVYDSVVDRVLGKLTAAHETDQGLVTTFEFVGDDPRGDAAARRVAGKFVTGMSIGYLVKRQSTPSKELREQGVYRIIEELELQEVSLVVFPMNKEATVLTTSEKSKAIQAALARGDARMAPDKEAALRNRIDSVLQGRTIPAEGMAPDHPTRIRLEEFFRESRMREIAQSINN